MDEVLERGPRVVKEKVCLGEAGAPVRLRFVCTGCRTRVLCGYVDFNGLRWRPVYFATSAAAEEITRCPGCRAELSSAVLVSAALLELEDGDAAIAALEKPLAAVPDIERTGMAMRHEEALQMPERPLPVMPAAETSGRFRAGEIAVKKPHATAERVAGLRARKERGKAAPAASGKSGRKGSNGKNGRARAEVRTVQLFAEYSVCGSISLVAEKYGLEPKALRDRLEKFAWDRAQELQREAAAARFNDRQSEPVFGAGRRRAA